jgi:endonuclease YncB( thermonuclease family)
LALALLLLGALFAYGSRAIDTDPLQTDGGGTVVTVVDGDTVILDNGIEVRLVGLQAPKLALGRRNFVDWPLAGDARRALERLSLGRAVELRFGGRRGDRHGRTLAHLFRQEDGVWIQLALLRQGMARVYSFPDNREAVAELLAAERAARADELGIWAHPYYRLRAPEQLSDALDTFQIVEGRVVEAARVRGRVYLNFGADWREDFTVTVAPDDRRVFESEGDRLGAEAVDTLAGQRVRVRGWIKSFNGPMIEVTHPEQVEWLD